MAAAARGRCGGRQDCRAVRPACDAAAACLHPPLPDNAGFEDPSMTNTAATPSQSFRTERDSMGEMKVPADAYYGAQTARAVENFPISDLRFDRRFIAAMGLIKWAAAEVNRGFGLIDEKREQLIKQAAQEVIDGR